ncbi:4-alpha-glucanotransferase [uncultured Sphingomonas sp.]|uniref:4-alpha-glucanotransferase n=1 Tax=uncultured Sphingomonas sp. TaxID=158754 RepID=UPI0035CB6253
MTALHDLARAAGLQVDWQDALGKRQRVGDDTLVAILAALGYPADEDRAIADSRRRADDHGRGGFLSADVDTPVALPDGWAEATLVLEDGTERRVESGFSVAAIGYHRLIRGEEDVRLAIAPPRCFRVGDAAGGRRAWAAAAQITSLRDARTTPYGDLGTLAETVRALGRRGADAVAISPTHALFPADASRYSPYAPSSRLFHNILLGDPALAAMAVASDPGDELIDWSTAIPARLAQLRTAWRGAREPVRDAVALFRERGGGELERHARFDALHAHFFAASDARGWREWPSEYHDPAGDAVARFAEAHADDVAFYAFGQWLAAASLDAAQGAARQSGMAIGLVADLAVGMDPGGSHAWSRPDDLLVGLSIGAPPDLLGPDGQSWGITGFAPAALRRTGFDAFIATLRAAIGRAGGIRIDHALGLARLWVVPDGASAKEGAYLTMPMDDLMRIVAIESVKFRAIVIGEDLGTVPPGLRDAMDARAMLGMRVLQFERDGNGGFTPPRNYESGTAAMTGTHDLPTIAGWWRGRDIDWTWDLGRTSRAPDKAHDLATREEDKAAFWTAAVTAGVGEGIQPDRDEPDRAVDTAMAFVGATPSVLAIVPLEDIAGAIEQPNIPGTIDEHPNWRRRLAEPTEAILDRPAVARRIADLKAARTS